MHLYSTLLSKGRPVRTMRLFVLILSKADWMPLGSLLDGWCSSSQMTTAGPEATRALYRSKSNKENDLKPCLKEGDHERITLNISRSLVLFTHIPKNFIADDEDSAIPRINNLNRGNNYLT